MATEKKYFTTLIIGNGFDLNLGMNTGYEAFRLWLEKTGFFLDNEDNPIIAFIYSRKKGQKNWSDFENLMLEYARQSDDAFLLRKAAQLRIVIDNLLLGKYTTARRVHDFEDLKEICPTLRLFTEQLSTNRKIDLPTRNKVKPLCNLILEELENYSKKKLKECKSAVKLLSDKLEEFLNQAEPKNEYSEAVKLIATLWGLDTLNIDTIAWEASSRPIEDFNCIRNNFIVVSFNYTDTVGNVYKLLQTLSDKYNDNVGKEIRNQLGEYIYRIHGTLGSRIAFGTSDEKDIPQELWSLKKRTILEDNTKRKFADILRQSKRIVIVGHSLHGIDFDYYRDFFKNKKTDTEVYVLYHTESAHREIEEGLQRLGVEPFVKYRKIAMGDEGFNELCSIIGHDHRDGVMTFMRGRRPF